jgi:hypothetical protein
MKLFQDVTILIADGQNDANGTTNGTPSQWILPTPKDAPFLSVRRSYSLDDPIGRALNFRWDGEKLLADLEILENEDVARWFPCVGGQISGTTIELVCVAICDHNIDPRIPSL